MVSIKTIKGLDFETIEDYFQYIIDSRTNGQRKQAKELFNKLSARQKLEFDHWFMASFHYEAIDNDSASDIEHAGLMIYLKS